MRRASFFALLPWAWCIPTQVPFSSKAETEYRNYSNHQLWQLESTNELPQTFFPLLEVLGNISLWHATPSSVQIQVPPLWSPNIDALVASLQHFSGVELKSTLLVEDIGSLIPPVTPLSTYTQQFYQFSNLLTQEPANPHEMFHPYSAIHSLMYQMAADYSEFASISKIGETEEGKDVLALKVGYLSGDEKLGSQGGKRRRKGSDEEEEDVELMSLAVISGLHASILVFGSLSALLAFFWGNPRTPRSLLVYPARVCASHQCRWLPLFLGGGPPLEEEPPTVVSAVVHWP
ncbi:hypothetical protein BT69DRAFT_1359201 [Atractiella rhizophila]|nr:hypothetical protein BT69DRAFT_1359201 [Atractiella rhizophila]